MLVPFVRIIEDGVADGSLAGIEEPWPFAAALSNAVTLPYVHLRVHHAEFGWTSRRTRQFVLGLVSEGYLPRPR